MAVAPFNAQVARNPLRTKAQCEQALIDLLTPGMELMIKNGRYGRFRMSDSGAVYSQDRTSSEGFARLLWGLGPLFHNRDNIRRFGHWWQFTCESLINCTDPTHPDYWGGELTDYDQLFVEMGAITAFLYETKSEFWDHLTTKQQNNIFDWLEQVNHKVLPKTNWLLFRTLVNSWFADNGHLDHAKLVQDDFDITNSHYLGHGWSYDGYVNQIDNYIPFAYQFFTLVLVGLTKKNGKQEQLLKERATAFVPSYANWFTSGGACLPYGRSLDYRFAQAAFWAAASFAGVEPPEGWSIADFKHLLLNNLRWWFSQNIFQSDGLIPIGYAYPNMNMAEGYNGPASAYWALKTFIFLCIPDDDPFWQVREAEDFKFEPLKKQPEPRMLVAHSATGREVQAFTAGQHSHEHAHANAKYEKYVYSTTFAFSVPKATVLLKQGAYDSTLAVSESDHYWQIAYGYEDYAIHDEYVYSEWKPWKDVDIKNFVVPDMPWHVRVHVIDSARELHLAEGGFSLPDYGETIETGTPNSVFYRTEQGIIGLVGADGFDVELSTPEPNVNILYPKTRIPMQTRVIEPGRYVFVSLYLGDAEGESLNVDGKIAVPEFHLDGNVLTVGHKTVTLTELA
ncbi:hypothetical protein DSM100688_1760 [Bifidobacterium ramosum]|uniref:DUF2264 domain-containing protein n=1 Tax=Bifidobacterium ramosum TaxID=1798158 RepID=A0A6L4WY35_9BIFI|nr:DUF2264 domain-containing protein [Bifidobacterium ramosum]KAB8287185.1 hypothetical protein DSM100688_1760 [Bifidobacterium ramosum]NEG71898.1 DUF2264 domain-containing protein [Bifidobacterium ramosum]